LCICSAAGRAYSKPMLGIGEPPMLRNGYAKYVLDVCWPYPILVSRAPWFDVCPIVGNADPNIPLRLLGNAMLLVSRSFAACEED